MSPKRALASVYGRHGRMTASRAAIRLNSSAGRRLLAASVLSSCLLTVDATLSRMALPALGSHLSTDFSGLQWVMSSYALTLAAIILFGGALGDTFDPRKVLLFGVALFAVASAACAAAPGLEWLLVARAMQGAGAAILAPVSLSVLETSVGPGDRVRAVASWVALSGAAGAIAPFIGGWLLEATSWRALFLVNPVLASVVLLLVWAAVPAASATAADERPQLDLVGAALCLLAISSLYVAISAVADIRSAGWGLVGAVIAAVGAGTGFLMWEARTPHPMVPLRSIRNATFRAANTVTFFAYISINGFMFLLVLQLQVGMGFSPTKAGAALVPVTVLSILLSGRVAHWTTQKGWRRPIGSGLLLCAAGCLLASQLKEASSYVFAILPTVCVFGVGLVLVAGPLTSESVEALGPDHAGLSTGLNSAVSRIGGLLAVSVLPSAAGIDSSTYDDPERFLDGTENAMAVCAVLLVVACLWSLRPLPHSETVRIPTGPLRHPDVG